MDNIDKILRKNIPADELYHFGILGMKWGKRNGPPYPLDKKAVQKLKKEYNKIAKRKKEKGWDSTMRSYQKTKIYKDMSAREKVKTAKQELQKFEKDYDEYKKKRREYTNEVSKIMEKYPDEWGLSSFVNDPNDPFKWSSENFLDYSYETDGDYALNSFTMYLYKTGREVSKYFTECKIARENFDTAVNDTIDEMLGDHKDLTAHDYYGSKRKLQSIIREAAGETISEPSWFFDVNYRTDLLYKLEKGKFK